MGRPNADNEMGNARSATRPPRKRAKRGKKATTERLIQTKARERQRAWAEGDRPNVTASLSADLNGPDHLLRPEGLFAKGRQEMAGEMEPGSPKTSGAFRS